MAISSATPDQTVAIFDNLDCQQKAVVMAKGNNTIVLAGAGTGKTTTMVALLAKLIIIDGVEPERILMSTFTKAAAASMKARLDAKLKAINYHGEGRPYIGTFHGFAYRMLKRNFRILGFSKAPEPIDDEDLKTEVKGVLNRNFSTGEKPLFNARQFVAAMSFAANKRISIGDAIASKLPPVLRKAGMKIAEKCQEELVADLQTKGLLTYDQMILRWIEAIAENPNVGNELSLMLDVVIVDEFQDNNRLLYDFISLLNPTKRIMVGDVNQCIYSFRGSDLSLIKEFSEGADGVESYEISTNYRSGPAILSVANSILSGSSYPMRLRAANGCESATVLPRVCPGDHSPAVMADFTEELLADGVPANEICFLFRSAAGNQSLLGLELQLKSRHIPARILAGMSISKRREVKDFASLLSMIYAPSHPLRATRACSVFAGSGEAKYVKEAATHFAQMMDGSLDADLFGVVNTKVSKRALDIADRLVNWVNACRMKDTAPEGVAEMLRLSRGVLEKKYFALSKNDRNPSLKANERLMRLQEIVQQAKAWTNLPSLVDDLLGLDPEAPKNGEDKLGVVTLSTIHSAKGLEWGYVVLVDPTERNFSSRGANDENGGGTAGEDEEFRRLLYVAVTRAKRVLVPLIQTGSMFGDEPSSMLQDLEWESVYSGANLVNSVSDDIGGLPFARKNNIRCNAY